MTMHYIKGFKTPNPPKGGGAWLGIFHGKIIQEAQLSLTNRALLVCKVVEVWQDVLSEYVDKKFTYICYRRLIRHE